MYVLYTKDVRMGRDICSIFHVTGCFDAMDSKLDGKAVLNRKQGSR